MSSDLDELSINTIRTLAIDAVEAAKSGHPGAPMGAASMGYELWTRHMKHNPANPDWPDRDRFVLSAGHASMLLYALLHLSGYPLSLDELKAFRQWESETPGHPEAGHTQGVEVTTGPLGAGFSMAVGMAIAEAYLGAYFNRDDHRVVDHYTYGICSDGDLMEGVASEAASLAGTLGLGKLIFLYDDNRVTIDGETDLSFTEDVGKRFEAYGWQVQHIDGNDLAQVSAALESARSDQDRPSLIVARTTIGHGSPNKAGKAAAHGAPLGPDEARETKEALGWPTDAPYHVPGEVREAFGQVQERGKAAEAEWDTRFAAWAAAYPELADEWRRWQEGTLPEGWKGVLPCWEADTMIETRVASGQIINALAPVLRNLVGGSADLAGSNNTLIKEAGPFSREDRGGRNIYYGVREHTMAGALNGIARHGGMLPFAGTFLTFSDYMRPALRLAAIMRSRAVFVFTHDSIGLGEDGPTHQPIEHLASLRAMPGMSLVRPADANETRAAWALALEQEGPTALALTRQKVRVVTDAETAMEGVARGAYVVRDAAGGEPDVILMATGSEVSLAVDAAGILEGEGIAARVVSMPSWDRFEQQDRDYRERVLPRSVRARVAMEAGATLGWHRWVGEDGEIVGIDRFGASAPYAVIYEQLGITADAMADAARRVLERVQGAG
ncbi:MAG: transketolase [Dehalococcoidia bacterium]|nr:transketolase [Dehalococcoidia bacterium]